MKKIVTGIIAHVDTGKTTLSEGLLYCAGEIRNQGRVDKKNTFLDTNELERKRGITIFSKQAIINYKNTQITLLDTPGHIDFSAEAERTLQVLDYAILLISATDGIQSHTSTLWNLLKKNNIPTFIFINKTDLVGADTDKVFSEIASSLSQNIIDFTKEKNAEFYENLATLDEEIMEEFLNGKEIDNTIISQAIKKRNVFPVFYGSALKNEGVEHFLESFCLYTMQGETYNEFGGKVFKISTDEKGNRLTFLKVTGGEIKVKSLILDNSEKINEIRIYSGEKYKVAEKACQGDVCALVGPKKTYAGLGLGFEENNSNLSSQPIFNYKVILPDNIDVSVALQNLYQLEQEETLLNVSWNEHLKEINISLMGEIQLEILKHQILNRFGYEVIFEEGNILYKETIKGISEGVGHYEPLRHYAEVHLLLEALPKGSGMQFAVDCPEDFLDKNWQRLILTHLMEKPHLGVLTGSPITDIKITLKSGKAHEKHTEGGDFRQATYRAVRHGLKNAQSVLLEPFYDFVLTLPSENVGKAMSDLDRMGASFSLPQIIGDNTRLKGIVPAKEIRNYQKDLISYTHGKGKLSCSFSCYDVCKNPQEVIESINYDFEADVENSADSVFCSHGAGFNVKWDQVFDYMHLESVLKHKKEQSELKTSSPQKSSSATDEELLKIFEKTYGQVKTKFPQKTMYREKEPAPVKYKKPATDNRKEFLLIDGYNIIFAWDNLKKIANENLESARQDLIEKISVYKLFKNCEIIIVFDAYKVKGNIGEKEKINNINVVYTKESQTADAYIEKTVKELKKDYKVTVATSDNLEQLIIFGSGANRMSASILEKEVIDVEERVKNIISLNNNKTNASGIYKILEDKLKNL